MAQDFEVKDNFVYADVFNDLCWFAKEFQQCPSVKFEESGEGIPEDLFGRQFVFEPRTGENTRTGQMIDGILIYEVQAEGEEGVHFATISRATDTTEDPEVIFMDFDKALTADSVEVLLLVAQQSVVQFRGELGQPKVVH